MRNEIDQQAVEFFGTTDNPREAGYILADGTMLDFSGRHESEGYKWDSKRDRYVLIDNTTEDYLADFRSVDHRMVIDLPAYHGSEHGRDAMVRFMIDTGAARIHFGSGVEIARPLEKLQAMTIAKWWRKYEGIRRPISIDTWSNGDPDWIDTTRIIPATVDNMMKAVGLICSCTAGNEPCCNLGATESPPRSPEDESRLLERTLIENSELVSIVADAAFITKDGTLIGFGDNPNHEDVLYYGVGDVAGDPRRWLGEYGAVEFITITGMIRVAGLFDFMAGRTMPSPAQMKLMLDHFYGHARRGEWFQIELTDIDPERGVYFSSYQSDEPTEKGIRAHFRKQCVCIAGSEPCCKGA